MSEKVNHHVGRLDRQGDKNFSRMQKGNDKQSIHEEKLLEQQTEGLTVSEGLSIAVGVLTKSWFCLGLTLILTKSIDKKVGVERSDDPQEDTFLSIMRILSHN